MRHQRPRVRAHSSRRAPAPRARSVPRPRRNKRRRRIPAVLWLSAILIAEIIAVGLKDPRFNVARIEVRGTEVLAAEQVLRRSGLATGGNLFRAPLEGARRRVAKLPPVAEVSLHRRLPNRILIRVRERQPMACVATGGALFTIDETGVAFRRDRARPAGLPLASVVEGRKLSLGGRLNGEATRVLRECIGASRVVCPSEKARFSVDQNGNVCFNRDGIAYAVRLGASEQLVEKFSLLDSLERSLPEIRGDCEYIDLSCLEAPAWKPKPVDVAAHDRPALTPEAGATEDSQHGRGGSAED